MSCQCQNNRITIEGMEGKKFCNFTTLLLQLLQQYGLMRDRRLLADCTRSPPVSDYLSCAFHEQNMS